MRWNEIFEKVTHAYLYHGTSPDNAAHIIISNKLVAYTGHQNHTIQTTEKHRDKYNVYGVSLTRNAIFAREWTSDGGVVFVLDQEKLRHRHLIQPFLYYRADDTRVDGRREAEEFVVGLKGITPLDQYLVEIRIPRKVYDACCEENAEYDNPEEDSRYWALTSHPLLKII